MDNRRDDAAPESALIDRARNGDLRAFEQLVLRHQDRVMNLCLRLVGHYDDALDLTQDTFVRAYEALPDFRGRSRFFTWLYRIAVNTCLSHRRRRAAAPDTFASLQHAHVAEAQGARLRLLAGHPAEDPAIGAARREQHELIEQAIERLDPPLRAVVVLRDILDLDYAEIAAVLDIPRGTVKSRLHRARLALRDMLAPLWTKP